MPIAIKKESLFTPMFGIKYITNLDDKFQANRFPGTLLFYTGNPLYIVNVALFGNRRDLQEDDIEITLGDRHNSDLAENIIREKHDTIYEICKSYYRPYFILDVERMQIVEPDDFNNYLPVRGINTLFRFENGPKQTYFILINSTGNANDQEIMAWFRSYIYSGIVCLSPLFQPTIHAKQFLQVICGLSASKGKTYYFSDNPLILESPMNDMGEFELEIPGNDAKRFKELAVKSVEQKGKKKKK